MHIYEFQKGSNFEQLQHRGQLVSLLYTMLIPGDPKPKAPANLPSRESTKSYWLRNPTPFLQHHRTTPSLPTIAQVVIIGSGISGAFAARELLEDDSGGGIVNSVLMLEAREACWGATGRVCC